MFGKCSNDLLSHVQHLECKGGNVNNHVTKITYLTLDRFKMHLQIAFLLTVAKEHFKITGLLKE